MDRYRSTEGGTEGQTGLIDSRIDLNVYGALFTKEIAVPLDRDPLEAQGMAHVEYTTGFFC